MAFNSLVVFIEVISILMGCLVLINFFFKRRKRSAESIYNLIYDLEKKLNSIG